MLQARMHGNFYKTEKIWTARREDTCKIRLQLGRSWQHFTARLIHSHNVSEQSLEGFVSDKSHDRPNETI